MQIILMEKVANLGQLGDIVKVRDGYARNFLIPQGKAKRATQANLAEFEAKRAELERVQGETIDPCPGAGREARRPGDPGHAEGGRRRQAVRFGHQHRRRRRAEGRGFRRAARVRSACPTVRSSMSATHALGVVLHPDVTIAVTVSVRGGILSTACGRTGDEAARAAFFFALAGSERRC